MLFRPEERHFAQAVSRIAYDNPFAPERIESERVALGREFTEGSPVWSADGAQLERQGFHRERPNVVRLRDLSWHSALALRARLDELRIIHLALRQTKVDQPSRNFTQLVMGKLDGYVERSTFPIRNGIILLTGVLVAVGIVALLVSSGVFDQTQTIVDLNKINLPKEYIQEPLPTIPFNGKLLINIIIALNLGLAWIVLDRAILKPYFQRRMQMH